jgi:FkbM family methyltransferase
MTVATMYSQNLEQVAILAAFKGWPTGKFLDIGAFHAKQLSNTRALFELGWSGVMVEPSPVPFAGLVEEYGTCDRIRLIHAAVGLNSGILRMHVTADAVSTAVPEVYEHWKETGQYDPECIDVECVALDEIYALYGEFDFVNIDAEGMSADLLIHRVLHGPLPRCICVEHDNRAMEILTVATGLGYACTYTSGENLVLVK